MPVGVYEHKKKHGMLHYPEYKVWIGMRNRCNSKKHKAYSYYGGRGISVSKEWDSFKTFIEDMGRRPEGCSLDRIDPNGNYCKENCRWATKIQQANNTRDNRKIPWNGKIYGIRELSEFCGVSQKLLAKRLFERGWSIKRAIQNISFIGNNQFNQ